jgi:hypothetical protein
MYIIGYTSLGGGEGLRYTLPPGPQSKISWQNFFGTNDNYSEEFCFFGKKILNPDPEYSQI